MSSAIANAINCYVTDFWHAEDISVDSISVSLLPHFFVLKYWRKESIKLEETIKNFYHVIEMTIENFTTINSRDAILVSLF